MRGFLLPQSLHQTFHHLTQALCTIQSLSSFPLGICLLQYPVTSHSEARDLQPCRIRRVSFNPHIPPTSTLFPLRTRFLISIFVVAITLLPVDNQEDPTPASRYLTLSEDNPVIPLGRSSKRETRNREPASDNGWYESRVMSREHAELSLENEASPHSLTGLGQGSHTNPSYSTSTSTTLAQLMAPGSTTSNWSRNRRLLC